MVNLTSHMPSGHAENVQIALTPMTREVAGIEGGNQEIIHE